MTRRPAHLPAHRSEVKFRRNVRISGLVNLAGCVIGDETSGAETVLPLTCKQMRRLPETRRILELSCKKSK